MCIIKTKGHSLLPLCTVVADCAMFSLAVALIWIFHRFSIAFQLFPCVCVWWRVPYILYLQYMYMCVICSHFFMMPTGRRSSRLLPLHYFFFRAIGYVVEERAWYILYKYKYYIHWQTLIPLIDLGYGLTGEFLFHIFLTCIFFSFFFFNKNGWI